MSLSLIHIFSVGKAGFHGKLLSIITVKPKDRPKRLRLVFLKIHLLQGQPAAGPDIFNYALIKQGLSLIHIYHEREGRKSL